MNTKDKIDSLVSLGRRINQDIESDAIMPILQQAKVKNPWFTEDNTKKALKAIADTFLAEETIMKVIDHYALTEIPNPLSVGIVMAGNIPAVGFHDVLCTFLSGHQAMIKYSSKDDILIPYLIELLISIAPQAEVFFKRVDRLKNYDAIIATGGNNTSRYFEYYFKSVPHIIRKNRNGVGVLGGNETPQDIINLGLDIFTYFGLGCRNVSKVYVPRGYDLTYLLEHLHTYQEIIMHNKYKNNFDYNAALFLLNKVDYLNNGCLILKEDRQIASRIACLHYEYYDSSEELTSSLQSNSEAIQCVVSKESIEGYKCFDFGEAQKPGFFDYADGVDTMQFLTRLS